MKNTINHFEFRTKDAERLKGFYGGLFKWKFDDVEPGHYTMIDMGGKDVEGGILQITDGQQVPQGASPYIAVSDLAAAEEKVKSLGGQIFLSRQEVKGWGFFTVFADPDGNVLHLWERMAKKERKAAKKVAKKEKKAAKKAAKAAKKTKASA
jgi:predicted enzyme related to lactoylglutathione lyase